MGIIRASLTFTISIEYFFRVIAIILDAFKIFVLVAVVWALKAFRSILKISNMVPFNVAITTGSCRSSDRSSVMDHPHVKQITLLFAFIISQAVSH